MAGHCSSSAEIDWKLIKYEPNTHFQFDCPVQLNQKDCDTYRPGPSQEVTDWSLINIEPEASREISSQDRIVEHVTQPTKVVQSGAKLENVQEAYASGSQPVEDRALIHTGTSVCGQYKEDSLESYKLDDVEPGPSKGRVTSNLQTVTNPIRASSQKDNAASNADNQRIQGSQQVAKHLHEHGETCFETDHELPGSSKTTKMTTILKKSSPRIDPEFDATDPKQTEVVESSNSPCLTPYYRNPKDFIHKSYTLIHHHEKDSKKHVHFDSTSECSLFNKEPNIQYHFPKEKCAASACGQTLCRLRESSSNKTRLEVYKEQPSNILEMTRDKLGFNDEKREIQLIIPCDGNKNMSANEDPKDESRCNEHVGQSVGDFTSPNSKLAYQSIASPQEPPGIASNNTDCTDILDMEAGAKRTPYTHNSCTVLTQNTHEAFKSQQTEWNCIKTQSHTEKMVALFTKLQAEQISQPLPLEKMKRRRHTEGIAAERTRDFEEKIAKVTDETPLTSHQDQRVEKILPPTCFGLPSPDVPSRKLQNCVDCKERHDGLHHANVHPVNSILIVLHSMQNMLVRMAKMSNATGVNGCQDLVDHDPNKRPPFKLSCPKDREMMPDGLFAYSIAHQVVGQALKKISELYPACAEQACTESIAEKDNGMKDSISTVLALTAMKETLKELEGPETDKSYASTAVETSNSLASVTIESDHEEDQSDRSKSDESDKISLSLIRDLLETNNPEQDTGKVNSGLLSSGTLNKQNDLLQIELKQMSYELVSRTMKEALGVLMTARKNMPTDGMSVYKTLVAAAVHSEEKLQGSLSDVETHQEEKSVHNSVSQVVHKRDDNSIAYFMQSISDEVHGLIRKLFNHLKSIESKEELSAILTATKTDSSISVDTVLNGMPICTTPESDVSSLDAMVEDNSFPLTTLAGESSTHHTHQKTHVQKRDTAADLNNVKQQLDILSRNMDPVNNGEEHFQFLSMPGKFCFAPSLSAQELPPEGAQEWCPISIDMPFGNGSFQASNDSTKCLNSRSLSADSCIERLLKNHRTASHSEVSSRDNFLSPDEDSRESSPYTTPSALLSLQTSGDSRDQMFSSTGFGNVHLVRSEDLLYIPPRRLLMAGGNHPEHVQQADLNRPSCSNSTNKRGQLLKQPELQSGALESKSEREGMHESKRQQYSCNCVGPCHHQHRGSKCNITTAARHKQSSSEPKLDFYRRTKVLPCPKIRRNLLENPECTNSDWTSVGWFPPWPTEEALNDESSCEIDNENLFTELGETVTTQETAAFGLMASSLQTTLVNQLPRKYSNPSDDDCLELNPHLTTSSFAPSGRDCCVGLTLSDNQQTSGAADWDKDPFALNVVDDSTNERVCIVLETNREHRNTNEDGQSETFRKTSQPDRVNPTPDTYKRTANRLNEEKHVGSNGRSQNYQNSASKDLSAVLTSQNKNLNGIGRMGHRYEPYPTTTSSCGTSVDALQQDIIQLNDRVERGMEVIKSTMAALCEAIQYPYAERTNSTVSEAKEALSYKSHTSSCPTLCLQHGSTHNHNQCGAHSPEVGFESSCRSFHCSCNCLQDLAVERKASTSVDLESVSHCCTVPNKQSRNPRLSISAPTSKWRCHCHQLSSKMRDEQRCSCFHKTAYSDILDLPQDPKLGTYNVARNVPQSTQCNRQSSRRHCCCVSKAGSCCADTSFSSNFEKFGSDIVKSVSRASESEFRTLSQTSFQDCVQAPDKSFSRTNEINLPNRLFNATDFSAFRGPPQAAERCIYEGSQDRAEEARQIDDCRKTSCYNHCDSVRGSFVDVDGFAEISHNHMAPNLAARVQKLMRKGNTSRTARTTKCSNSTQQEYDHASDLSKSPKVKINDQLNDDSAQNKPHTYASAEVSHDRCTHQSSHRTVSSSDVDAAFNVIQSLLKSYDNGTSADGPVCMRVISSNVDKSTTGPCTHFKVELAELSTQIPDSDWPYQTENLKDKNACCISSLVSIGCPGNFSTADNSDSSAQFTQQNAATSTHQRDLGGEEKKSCASSPNKFSAFFVRVDQKDDARTFFVQSVPQSSTIKEFTDVSCQVSDESLCRNLQRIPKWYESDSSEVSVARSESLSKITDSDGDFCKNPEDLTIRNNPLRNRAVTNCVTPDKVGTVCSHVSRMSSSAKDQVNFDNSRSQKGSNSLCTTLTNSSIVEGMCEISHSGCEACNTKATGHSSNSCLRVISSRSLTYGNLLSMRPLSRRSSSMTDGVHPLRIPRKDIDVQSDFHKNEMQPQKETFSTSNSSSHADSAKYDGNTGQVASCFGVNVMQTGNAAPYYAIISASDSVDPLCSSAWTADAEVERHPEPVMPHSTSCESSHVDPIDIAVVDVVDFGCTGKDNSSGQEAQNNMNYTTYTRTSCDVTPGLCDRSKVTEFTEDEAIPADCLRMSSALDIGSSSSKLSCFLSQQSGAAQHNSSIKSKTKSFNRLTLPPDPHLARTAGEDISRARQISHQAMDIEAFGEECSYGQKQIWQSHRSSRYRPKPTEKLLEPHVEEQPFSSCPHCSSSFQSASPVFQRASMKPQSDSSETKLCSHASSHVDPFMSLYDPTWFDELDSPDSERTMQGGTTVNQTRGLDEFQGGSLGMDTKGNHKDSVDVLIRSISEELCTKPKKEIRSNSKEDSWAVLQKMNLNSRATRMVLENRLKSLHQLLKKMESSENLVLPDIPSRQQSPVPKTSSRETASPQSVSHPSAGENWLRTCNSEELVQVVEHQP